MTDLNDLFFKVFDHVASFHSEYTLDVCLDRSDHEFNTKVHAISNAHQQMSIELYSAGLRCAQSDFRAAMPHLKEALHCLSEFPCPNALKTKCVEALTLLMGVVSKME
jgi:hypothetical protein